MKPGVGHIRTVLFDIGGTLLDFEVAESRRHLRAGVELAYAYLREQGLDPGTSGSYRRRIERRFVAAYLWARLRGREVDSMKQLKRIHTRIGIALDDGRLRELARRLYRPIHDLTHTDSETVPALGELRRRGYALGLISNTIAPPPGLDDHLASHGLLEHFPIRIYSCQVGFPKPHPRIFAVALERMGVEASAAMYVGDKPRIDVAGARRAGMCTVLRRDPTRPRAPGPDADYEINQIADLLTLLDARR